MIKITCFFLNCVVTPEHENVPILQLKDRIMLSQTKKSTSLLSNLYFIGNSLR